MFGLSLGSNISNSDRVISPGFHAEDFGTVLSHYTSEPANVFEDASRTDLAESGDTVLGVTDISGNDRHLSVPSASLQRPTWVAGTRNFDSYISLDDAANDKLFSTNSGGNGYSTTTNGVAVFMVMQLDTISGNNKPYIFGAEDDNKSFVRFDQSCTEVDIKTFKAAGDTDTISLSTTPEIDKRLLVVIQINDADNKAEVSICQNSTITRDVASTSYPDADYKLILGTIGSSGSLGQGNNIDGRIYEFLSYDGYLGDTSDVSSSANKVARHLMNKYEI